MLTVSRAWNSCFIRLKQLFHTLETVVSYAWNSCFMRLKQWGCGILQRKSPVNKREVGTFSHLSQNLVFSPHEATSHWLDARSVFAWLFTYNPMRVGAFVFRPSNLGVLTDSSVFVAFKKFVRFMWSASRFLLWVCSSAKSKKYDRFAENRRVVKGGCCKFRCNVFAAIVP